MAQQGQGTGNQAARQPGSGSRAFARVCFLSPLLRVGLGTCGWQAQLKAQRTADTSQEASRQVQTLSSQSLAFVFRRCATGKPTRGAFLCKSPQPKGARLAGPRSVDETEHNVLMRDGPGVCASMPAASAFLCQFKRQRGIESRAAGYNRFQLSAKAPARHQVMRSRLQQTLGFGNSAKRRQTQPSLPSIVSPWPPSERVPSW